MKKRLSFLIILSFILALIIPSNLQTFAASASVTDHVFCGNSTNETSHSITTSGTTGSATDTANVGTISESYTTRYVSTSGSYFQYMLAINQNSPLTIQLREVRPNPHWGYNYGYDVYLNNTLVYKKDSAIACAGGGPYVSTFIETADPAIIGSTTCTLKIVSNSTNPAYFTDVWVYADFDTYVSNKGMTDKMTLAPLVGKDRDGTTALQTKITNDIAGINTNTNVSKGFAVLYDFLFTGTSPNYNTQQASQANMASKLDSLVGLATTNSLPIQLKFNTEWGGTPNMCDDGSGSTFGNIKYQQILWSDNDQYTDPGLSTYLGAKYNVKYGLSIPNYWGDTPWLTYNNSALNTFVSNQFVKGMAELKRKMYELQRDGQNLLMPLANSTETLYWAKVNGVGAYDVNYQNNVNGGVERYNLWGDFNNDAVAAASADGVTLDPTNGLDFNTEGVWLQKNLANRAQGLVNDIYNNLERERITANNNSLTYVTDMLRHKIFTEPYQGKYFPLNVDTRPIMETGIVSNGNPGSEYYIPTQLSHLMKSREFGTIADPNFETTGARDSAEKVAVLRQIFAMGGDHVTMYNYSTDMNTFCNDFADNMVSYDSTGSNQSAPSAIGIGPSTATDTIGQTFTVGWGNQMVNEIGFEVQKVGTTSNVKLQVCVYDSPSKTKMYSMRVLSNSELPTGYNWVSAYVPIFGIDHNSSCYIEVTEPGMTTGNYYALLGNNSNNYSGGQFYYNGTANGSVDMVFRTGVDLLKERNKSKVVSYRREAKDTEAEVTTQKVSSDTYVQAYLDEANTAYNNNDYKTSYQKAIKADSHRYPILYQVKGSLTSTLSPFPMSVNPQSKVVNLDVTSYSSTANTLYHKFKSYTAGNVTLTYTGGLATKTIYINSVSQGTGSVTYNAAAGTEYSVEVR